MTDPIGSVDASRESVYRATRWSVLSAALNQGGRLVVFLLLARLLTPDAFGLMAMAFVIIGFLNIIRDLGTGAAIIQRTELSSLLVDSVFWLNIACGLVLGGLVFACAPLGAMAFAEPRLAPVLQVMAVGFLIGTAGIVPKALLRRQLRFHHIAVAEIASMVVFAATALPLALLGFGVWSLVIATLASEFAITLLNWLSLKWWPRLRYDRHALAEIWKFSSNLTLSQVASYFLWQSDRIIVGRFLGTAELGIYTIANRLLGFTVRFLVPQLHSVLFPALSRSSESKIRDGFLRAEAGIAMIVFPVIIGVSLVGPGFVTHFLGTEWALAAILLPILGIRWVLQAVLQGVGTLYQVKGRTDLLLYWQIGSGAVFLVSYLAGLPWGLVGVAVAQVVAIVVLTYPGFAIPLRLIDLKVSRLASDLLPHLAANAAMALVVVGWLSLAEASGMSPWLGLGCAVLLGVVVYVIAALALKSRALDDLRGLLRR